MLISREDPCRLIGRVVTTVTRHHIHLPVISLASPTRSPLPAILAGRCTVIMRPWCCSPANGAVARRRDRTAWQSRGRTSAAMPQALPACHWPTLPERRGSAERILVGREMRHILLPAHPGTRDKIGSYMSTEQRKLRSGAGIPTLVDDGQGQDRTVDLPLFRIKDDRPGRAMWVYRPRSEPSSRR